MKIQAFLLSVISVALLGAVYNFVGYDLWLYQTTWLEMATPPTPSSGKVAVYAKATGEICSVADTGVEVCMSSGSGGGGISDGDKGDVTVSESGANWQVDTNAITDNEVANNITVDETGIASTLARDSEVAAGYQPLDSDLTDLSDGTLSDGAIAATITRDSEAAAAYQPLDSDLTSIAGLTTTSFGRGLLDDADATAGRVTLGAVIGTNVQAFDADLDDLADGTLSDGAIASTITRDSEAAAAYQPLDSDLTSVAALTTTSFGRGLLDDADGPAARTTIGTVIGTNVQAFDADLDDLADGTLTGSKVGSGVLWTNLASVPAGFADGIDDTGGGGSGNSTEVSLSIANGAGYYSTTVTSQTWVTSSSEIVCAPFGTTTDGLTAEAVTVGGLVATTSNRVAGESFDLSVFSPNGLTGTVRFHCLGV